MTVAAFVICVGINACNLAMTQTCSIALGDNVQFPVGAAGDRVFVTTDHMESLSEITPELANRIGREMRRVLGHGAVLDDDYIRLWNRQCARTTVY